MSSGRSVAIKSASILRRLKQLQWQGEFAIREYCFLAPEQYDDEDVCYVPQSKDKQKILDDILAKCEAEKQILLEQMTALMGKKHEESPVQKPFGVLVPLL